MLQRSCSPFRFRRRQTNTPLVLDNVEAWWNQLHAKDCKYQLQAVNAVDGISSVFDGEEWTQGLEYPDSKRQWCHLFADLAEYEREGLKAAAKHYLFTETSDRVFDAGGWWAQLPGYNTDVGTNATYPQMGRAMAVGYDDDGDDFTRSEEPGATLDVLTVALHTRAIDAFNALKSDADPTPTPAVPLVALLLLGAGLAARGAFLRR